jgi:rubrerythrin
MMRIWVTIFMLLALTTLTAARPRPRDEESVQQLSARAESAPLGDRPALYIRIARQQAEAADKLYLAENPEAGNSALNDVVTYSGKASDTAASSGKKLKDTEIALRKMAEKFRDVKHNLPFDDQAPVQEAIDRLEKMRTDLLSAMFGKKGKK